MNLAKLAIAFGLILCSDSLAQQDPAPPPAEKSAPAEAPAAEKPKEEPAKPAADAGGDKGLAEDLLGFPVRGRLTIRYRARWNDTDEDQDFYESLSTDVGDPLRHTLTAHLFLRATQDAGGDHAGRGPYVFDGITDTYDNTWNGRVYDAWLELHRAGPVESARLGRQILDETTDVFHMDGLRIDSAAWKAALSLQGGVYAGIPVHLYESSPRGDWILGAWAQVRPWTGARFRADYTALRDRYEHDVRKDNLWSASASQEIARLLTLSARFTMLDSRARDWQLRADFYSPDWDLRVNASWFQLLRRQERSPIDIDQMVIIVDEYYPYIQGRLAVAKGFGSHVVVEAGGEVRETRDRDLDEKFNRSFRRCFLSPSLRDWPLEGLDAGVTFEYWNVPHTSDGDTVSAGGDVTYRILKNLRASVGSSFALYKYDRATGLEREHVQTYYAKVSWSPWKFLKLDASYEIEDDDEDTFHAIRLSASLSF